MPEIKFTVMGVPQGKGRPRFTTRGGFARTYTPAATAAAEESIRFQSLKHRPADPLECPIMLNLVFCMPAPKSIGKKERALAVASMQSHTKKPDIDNLCKTVMDSLNGWFWVDDAQISELQAIKVYSATPRTEVTIIYA